MTVSTPRAAFFGALLGMSLMIASASAQDAPPASPAPSADPSSGRPAPPGEPDEEAVFLSVIEDIPLMPGLIEDETRAIVFDAAGGRLAETYVQGRLAAKAVREFYGETLPALGWLSERDSRWVREGEALTLEIKEGPNGIDARFSLSPARAR